MLGDVVPTFWVAASAIATAGMALFTAYLALKTRGVAEASLREAVAVEEQGKSLAKQAAATTEQAQLTRQILRASIQPWLTLGAIETIHRRTIRSMTGEPAVMTDELSPLTVGEQDEQLHASIRLRNVGAGLAILDPKKSHVVGWPSQHATNQEPMEYTVGWIGNPVLAPGEQVRMRFAVDFQSWHIDFTTLTHQQNNDGELYLDIIYSDVMGDSTSRARFFVSYVKSDDEWIVYGIDYFTPPDATTANPSVRF